MDLFYLAGTTYFYMYDGGDNSARNRILKSMEFFEQIVNSEIKEYENYNIAQSYYEIGNFYTDYIINSINIKEPSKEN